MAIAKVIYKESSSATGEVWMDVTQKTVTSATMLNDITALKNDGTGIVGNIALKSVTNLKFSSSTATFVVPSGYYSGAINWTITSKGAETFTPAETAQTIASYQWLTGSQTIAAISSTYVGTGVSRRTATNLTANGSTITAAAGYYSSAVSKAVGGGTATTPATTITANPTFTIASATGKITASISTSSNITPTVAAGYITTGTAGKVSVSGSSTYTLSTQAAKTITPTEAVQRAVSSYYWTTGHISVAAISSTYVGTGVPTIGATTIYPSTVQQTIASQQYLTGVQTFAPVTTLNLEASYIASGINVKVGDASNAGRIADITGTFQGGISVADLKTITILPSTVSQVFPSALVNYPDTQTYSTPQSVDTSLLSNGNIYLFSGQYKGRKQYDPTSYFNTMVTWNSGFTYSPESSYSIILTEGYVSTTLAYGLSFKIQDIGYSQVTANAIQLQSKTVTPTESTQTIIPDADPEPVAINPDHISEVTIPAAGKSFSIDLSSLSVGDVVQVYGGLYIDPGTQTVYNTTSINHTFVWTGNSYTYTVTGSAHATYGDYEITISSSAITIRLTIGQRDISATWLNDAIFQGMTGYGARHIGVAKGSPYIGLSSVTVGAISSTYVGTGVSTKASATYYPSTVQIGIGSQRYLTGVQTFASVTTLNLEASYIASGITVQVGDSVNAGRIASITGTMQSGELYAPIYKSLALRNLLQSSQYLMSEWTNSLSTISAGMFAGINMSGIFTFENVTYIGFGAFANTEVADWYYPGSTCTLIFPSCTYCGTTAFMGDANKITVYMPKLSKETGIRMFENSLLQEGYFSSLSIIGDAMFSSCKSLTYMSIPACQTISSGAFNNCVKLSSINAPECTIIGGFAFRSCSAMTEAIFPKCESIGYEAFKSCSSLTNISFPNCDVISSSAFYGCSLLSEVNFPVCTKIGYAAFVLCKSLQTISFPQCETIFGSAFTGCPMLSKINFPTCTSIQYSAFNNCSGLTEAIFPACTHIGSNAFYSCTALTTISFSLCTNIDSTAFYRCSALSIANFPACVSISYAAFGYCSNLTTCNFPACKVILGTAFANCSELTIISLPACSSISNYVFSSCSKLESVYLMNESVISAGMSIFYGTPIHNSSYLGYFGSIYVPSSLLASYKTATNLAYYSSRMVGI